MLRVDLVKRAQNLTSDTARRELPQLKESSLADKLQSSPNKLAKPSGIVRARASAALGIKRARSLVATRGAGRRAIFHVHIGSLI